MSGRTVRPTSAQIDAQMLDLTAGLLAQHGVQAMSVSMVATASGYSKAGVFRRFGDKDALVDATLRRCVQIGHEALERVEHEASPAHRQSTAARVMLDAALDWPGFIALALASITVREHDEFGGRLDELGDALLRMFDLPPLDEIDDVAPLFRALAALSSISVLSLFHRDITDTATAKKVILETAEAVLQAHPDAATE
ncbi:TetR/AcrR family transcriptional regulator [Demequina sp. NBRC 110052]|uniref:TetR/AcrR family transcriptional regulator n=1 Tax=Demequina sp. NBRC 110052 TaxID=1570341 RepID=UPI0009FEB68A|nr:TetR/AcrR family transcriptional regulator [Demequina sp. NBRC 110052]